MFPSELFSKIVLDLNMSKINWLGVRLKKFDQTWLSHTEQRVSFLTHMNSISAGSDVCRNPTLRVS